MITRLADTKLIPKEPALVEIRNRRALKDVLFIIKSSFFLSWGVWGGGGDSVYFTCYKH